MIVGREMPIVGVVIHMHMHIVHIICVVPSGCTLRIGWFPTINLW